MGTGLQTASGRHAQEFEDGLQAALPRQQHLIQLKLSVTKPGGRQHVGASWGPPRGRRPSEGLPGPQETARTSPAWGCPVSPPTLLGELTHRVRGCTWAGTAGRCPQPRDPMELPRVPPLSQFRRS